jgi:hypothetical protein
MKNEPENKEKLLKKKYCQERNGMIILARFADSKMRGTIGYDILQTNSKPFKSTN